ncbi:MAG: Gfo/Idh/MocA family oxidoreductase [Candidatus Nanoarchaeia archaeon]|nr:Gfo/Idh/MocA family oxidoreductase [Candidatus Nanoarchaeia archaeon]
MKEYNFAIIGVGGYIAPRHLQAIKDTGNKLVAALDPKDSVGILDKYSDDVEFFTEFERFDRYAEKLKRSNDNKKIDYVSICSPNYLHDAHIRFALRIGAEVICEKPIVINPWNLDVIQELEKETGKKVNVVLQLRIHPSLMALKEKIDNTPIKEKYDIEMTYITPRGKWYLVSWKGDQSKSGGVVMNIGVHLFDMLIWIFGKPLDVEVHHSNDKEIAGYMELEKAKVKWFLSTDKKRLPKDTKNNSFRLITLNGESIEFSDGFTDLHTTIYKKILEGKGFGLEDARPAIELVYDIKNKPVIEGKNDRKHSFLKNVEK